KLHRMLRIYQTQFFTEKGQKMRAKSGFTLVEILIVVVILGILAAVVIPQFTEASTEAKTSSLCTDLQTVRSQIELYKVQHNDNLPGVAVGTHTATAGFIGSLTSGTDIYGVAGSDYGPYMQKFPTNQFNNLATVREEAGASTAGANTHGWVYNTGTGAFQADDSAAHAAL
ncbi:MAG: type II secretion system protein, partial [Sedimentisphaerales bacterium]|nr:type II secretion system protein [Sedimentisphaerales bacterium]